jgi:hypothetical protein
MTERDTLSTAISEVRKELQVLPRYDEGLRLREAEDRRLSELVMTLRHEVSAMSKDFDERARNLSYLSEQRSYDNKRISGLQEENLTLLKRTEEQDTSVKSLVDAWQRQEKHIQELLVFKTELTREQVDWVESQRLAEEGRKRQMVEWQQDVEAQRSIIEESVKRIEEFTEAAARGRQTMAEVEAFQVQLRRDQNQVAELQRLAEERQRKELEEWQGEEEKRWKKHEMEWEHQWKEQYQRFSGLTSRLNAVEEELKALQQELSSLWRVHEVYSAHRLGEVQRWQSELEKVVAERDKLARKRR